MKKLSKVLLLTTAIAGVAFCTNYNVAEKGVFAGKMITTGHDEFASRNTTKVKVDGRNALKTDGRFVSGIRNSTKFEKPTDHGEIGTRERAIVYS